jgi:hypothetical protein
VIAGIIEGYASDHPRAFDTAEGIYGWWVAPVLQEASSPEVQDALDYLVDRNRMRRIAVTGASPVYGKAMQPGKAGADKEAPGRRKSPSKRPVKPTEPPKRKP